MEWQQQVIKEEERERNKKRSQTTFITNDDDEKLQRKVEAVSEGLLPNVAALFTELSDSNKKAVAEFIYTLSTARI